MRLVLSFPVWSDNEIKRVRFNAGEYAEIYAQGKPTRCSTITGFYIRFSGKLRQ